MRTWKSWCFSLGVAALIATCMFKGPGVFLGVAAIVCGKLAEREAGAGQLTRMEGAELAIGIGCGFAGLLIGGTAL